VARRRSRRGQDALGSLRIPFVRAFALGRAAASLSTQIVSITVGWELYERTGDAWALGLIGLIQAAPVLALSLPAGEVADRLSRRAVAMLSHSVLGIVAIGLALLSHLGAPVEWVYGLLLLGGVGRAFSQPAANALLPQLLRPAQLANANAWVTLTTQIAAVSGPAVGGLLIALSGAAGPAYVVAAAGQLLTVAMLATLPAALLPTRPQRRGAGDMFAGIGFIRRSPVFLASITLDLFGVLLGGAVALLPVFARDILEVGPAGLGLLRSAPSVGGVATALLVTRLAPWTRPGRVLLLAVAGFGLATIGFGLSRDLALSLACLVLAGACNTISAVIRKTLQQVITPNRLLGRANAIIFLFTDLSNELGAFESGAVAAIFGPVISVVGGGLGTVTTVALVALAWPALARIGPLHTLHPVDEPNAEAGPAAEPIAGRVPS
jgi:MFS family permease